MNIAQAKKIPLEAALRQMKAEETKAKPDRSEIWYLSPFREEKTASFKIDTRRNIWYDHGSGTGGDIIKLVQEHTRGTVSEALQWIKNIPATDPAQTPKPRITAQPPGNGGVSAAPDYELVNDIPLTNRKLRDYVKIRGLQPDLAAKHFREIHFKNTKAQKNLYGVGMENDAGGWNIRGAIGDFHAVIAPNNITTIYSQAEAHTLDVFEGGFDFLTKQEIYAPDQHTAAVVLNSASFAELAIQKILSDPKFAALQVIKLWFDNDNRGEEITQQFLMALHRKCDVGDMRGNYNKPDRNGERCKDLNQWWTDCPTARQQFKPQEARFYHVKWNDVRHEAVQSIQPK